MPERSYGLLLADMLESCTSILEYTRDLSFEGFMGDKKTRDAVIRNFEVLGEAARRVPERIRKTNAEIEWRKLSDLRNILIHDYFGINYTIVWNIIKDYLPLQFELLKKIVATS